MRGWGGPRLGVGHTAGRPRCSRAPLNPHRPRETLRSPGSHTAAGKPGTHVSVTEVRHAARSTRSQSYLGDPWPVAGGAQSSRPRSGPFGNYEDGDPAASAASPPNAALPARSLGGPRGVPILGGQGPRREEGERRPERAGVCRPRPHAPRCSLGGPARTRVRTSATRRPPRASATRKCRVGPRPPGSPAAERRAPAH